MEGRVHISTTGGRDCSLSLLRSHLYRGKEGRVHISTKGRQGLFFIFTEVSSLQRKGRQGSHLNRGNGGRVLTIKEGMKREFSSLNRE
jgi:hypothetical protein